MELTISVGIMLSQLDKDQILRRFASVVKATVKGNMIIASIQGTIGG